MDAAVRTEMREAEIDALIARRHAQRLREEAENRKIGEAWVESARKYNLARRQALWLEWWEWHSAQAKRHRTVMSLLVSHHDAEARRYAKLLGLEAKPDGPEAA
jgi:hypothetical protein